MARGFSGFTPAEIEFLRSQRIGRLATVGPTGAPHVMPVMYELREDGSLEFDADGIKLRNLRHEPRVALVVDTMGPRRGIAVQGRAEVIGPERVRLRPARRYRWGLAESDLT
ncbi:MAG TPA: pyridoxamine 5'-phosphate oxidase family protein [Candidatus Dormibacteraeota bacterium]|nr:pyridoxamine 5'-phosphate oxidase family protein [Candidatus Dormibacteraeota bacterium]